ncbi:Protein-glutamate methylesterase/protein-glutamine glutaminase [Streptomyces hirsutus]
MSGDDRTIRVLIADDQMMVREGFSVLLNAMPGIEVAGEAVNGRQAVERVRELAPDVVLMDIRMPELNGIEATREIVAADGAAKVLVLTTFDLDEYVYQALRAGASGFLLKDASARQLADGVRVVASGEALLAPTVTKRLVPHHADVSALCARGAWDGRTSTASPTRSSAGPPRHPSRSRSTPSTTTACSTWSRRTTPASGVWFRRCSRRAPWSG